MLVLHSNFNFSPAGLWVSISAFEEKPEFIIHKQQFVCVVFAGVK